MPNVPGASRGLAVKGLLALAAAALPALLVACILAAMLVTTVTQSERDVEQAMVAAKLLTDIRVEIEREHGFVARIPAELDLSRAQLLAHEAANVLERIDRAIAELASNTRIISPEAGGELRAVRRNMKKTADEISEASRSFAQTTALELLNGPYEDARKLAVTFLDAVASNVDRVAEQARTHLRASTQSAWQLAPAGLFGALLMIAMGVWTMQQHFLGPIRSLTRHVLRIRQGGTLEIPRDHRTLARQDELGVLCRSFDGMVQELAEARWELIAKSEAEVAKQVERLQAALSNMSQGLAMFDNESRLVICNRRYADLYGLTPDQVRPGTPLSQIVDARVANGVFASMDTAQHRSERLRPITAASDAIYELRDGRVVAVSRRPMRNGGWVATHEDITERRRDEARIAYLAHHDVLTDLPNRALLHERMEEAIAGMRDGGRRMAILMLDLDRFKEVNDTLGHPIGDALLKSVTARLRACVRESDTIARLGGDEFAILQRVSDPFTESTALAKRIQEEISAPFDIQGHNVVIGTSIGIVIAPENGSTSDELMKNADLALYRAKSEGRGTHRFFEPEMDRRMQVRRKLERDLRDALANGEFALHYQPLINTERNQICGFEALLRWTHPERGKVAPADFIPLAEETGLIVPIGEWVLRQACKDAATWPDDLKVAVNVSVAQFRSRNLVEFVIRTLAAAGLDPQRLELEITETVMLQDEQDAFEILTQLHAIGVRIALDDFGTGYSSLSNLRKFPFDKIKIDRSFLNDLSVANVDAVAVVRSIAQLGASLGMSTTAEGVETEDQMEQVRAEGCTEMQGFYLGRPMPAKDVTTLLSKMEANSATAA
jgi:diguanylate cyclase (GGDEF)-like protein/PAS domain S-box-containing protein